jgi:hypothetical protein
MNEELEQLIREIQAVEYRLPPQMQSSFRDAVIQATRAQTPSDISAAMGRLREFRGAIPGMSDTPDDSTPDDTTQGERSDAVHNYPYEEGLEREDEDIGEPNIPETPMNADGETPDGSSEEEEGEDDTEHVEDESPGAEIGEGGDTESPEGEPAVEGSTPEPPGAEAGLDGQDDISGDEGVVAGAGEEPAADVTDELDTTPDDNEPTSEITENEPFEDVARGGGDQGIERSETPTGTVGGSDLDFRTGRAVNVNEPTYGQSGGGGGGTQVNVNQGQSQASAQGGHYANQPTDTGQPADTGTGYGIPALQQDQSQTNVEANVDLTGGAAGSSAPEERDICAEVMDCLAQEGIDIEKLKALLAEAGYPEEQYPQEEAPVDEYGQPVEEQYPAEEQQFAQAPNDPFANRTQNPHAPPVQQPQQYEEQQQIAEPGSNLQFNPMEEPIHGQEIGGPVGGESPGQANVAWNDAGQGQMGTPQHQGGQYPGGTQPQQSTGGGGAEVQPEEPQGGEGRAIVSPFGSIRSNNGFLISSQIPPNLGNDRLSVIQLPNGGYQATATRFARGGVANRTEGTVPINITQINWHPAGLRNRTPRQDGYAGGADIVPIQQQIQNGELVVDPESFVANPAPQQPAPQGQPAPPPSAETAGQGEQQSTGDGVSDKALKRRIVRKRDDILGDINEALMQNKRRF